MKEFLNNTLKVVSHYLGAIIILIMLGIFIGVGIANSFFSWRIKEAVQVGGFVFDNKVYEVREKVTK